MQQQLAQGEEEVTKCIQLRGRLEFKIDEQSLLIQTKDQRIANLENRRQELEEENRRLTKDVIQYKLESTKYEG